MPEASTARPEVVAKVPGISTFPEASTEKPAGVASVPVVVEPITTRFHQLQRIQLH